MLESENFNCGPDHCWDYTGGMLHSIKEADQDYQPASIVITLFLYNYLFYPYRFALSIGYFKNVQSVGHITNVYSSCLI